MFSEVFSSLFCHSEEPLLSLSPWVVQRSFSSKDSGGKWLLSVLHSYWCPEQDKPLNLKILHRAVTGKYLFPCTGVSFEPSVFGDGTFPLSAIYISSPCLGCLKKRPKMTLDMRIKFFLHIVKDSCQELLVNYKGIQSEASGTLWKSS